MMSKEAKLTFRIETSAKFLMLVDDLGKVK